MWRKSRRGACGAFFREAIHALVNRAAVRRRRAVLLSHATRECFSCKAECGRIFTGVCAFSHSLSRPYARARALALAPRGM